MNNLSTLAHTLIPSEIIRQGNEINERIKAGEKIFNFTIGDFNPEYFPLPEAFEHAILQAYQNKLTNYPPAPGITWLREAVAGFMKKKGNLDYSPNQFLISSGGRPLIYAAYRTLVDKGDKVVYPVPSWNNNHYTHFVEGIHIAVEAAAESNFLPTADQLAPLLEDATLLSLCSPLNPTGTCFTKEQLSDICQLVLDVNRRRSAEAKPLYLLFDQIYWTLTFGDNRHYHPVELVPEMAPYTITIDGMSKAFCATGVRVGWAFGPAIIIDKMKGILSHVGAWSPMAEQHASAAYLEETEEVDMHIAHMQKQLYTRLARIYKGFQVMQAEGLPVKAIKPQGAMYLTICIDIIGKIKPDNGVIRNTDDITAYLLDAAHLAVVPFKAFGATHATCWYRLSVGVCNVPIIDECLESLRAALLQLR